MDMHHVEIARSDVRGQVPPDRTIHTGQELGVKGQSDHFDPVYRLLPAQLTVHAHHGDLMSPLHVVLGKELDGRLHAPDAGMIELRKDQYPHSILAESYRHIAPSFEPPEHQNALLILIAY